MFAPGLYTAHHISPRLAWDSSGNIAMSVVMFLTGTMAMSVSVPFVQSLYVFDDSSSQSSRVFEKRVATPTAILPALWSGR
jgi:hypothetical protein